MPTSPVFSRIDSVVLRVHDRAAAVEWYRTRLGFQVLFAHLAIGVAVLDLGRGDTLTLWELGADDVSPVEDMPAAFPVFEATNAEEQRAELVARGVTASELRSMPGIRCFSFWDLDGNRLEACELLDSRIPSAYRVSATPTNHVPPENS